MEAEAGQLQLNVTEPFMGYPILESQTMFMNGSLTLPVHCVEDIVDLTFLNLVEVA